MRSWTFMCLLVEWLKASRHLIRTAHRITLLDSFSAGRTDVQSPDRCGGRELVFAQTTGLVPRAQSPTTSRRRFYSLVDELPEPLDLCDPVPSELKPPSSPSTSLMRNFIIGFMLTRRDRGCAVDPDAHAHRDPVRLRLARPEGIAPPNPRLPANLGSGVRGVDGLGSGG